jgi:hypothetical protein
MFVDGAVLFTAINKCFYLAFAYTYRPDILLFASLDALLSLWFSITGLMGVVEVSLEPGINFQRSKCIDRSMLTEKTNSHIPFRQIHLLGLEHFNTRDRLLRNLLLPNHV